MSQCQKIGPSGRDLLLRGQLLQWTLIPEECLLCLAGIILVIQNLTEQAKHIEAKHFDNDDARMYFRENAAATKGFNGVMTTEMVK